LRTKLRILFHLAGLACLSGSAFLATACFADIAGQGYFVAVEGDVFILFTEIVLVAFAWIYLISQYVGLAKRVRGA